MAITVAAEFEDKEVRAFLRNMDSRLKDIKGGRRQYASLISVLVFRDVIDHFKNEEGPEGKWKAWSDKYKFHMQKIGKSGNLILTDDRTLVNNNRFGNFRNQSNGILFFNPTPYAEAHDEGSPKKNLPARPFMWLSKHAMDEISQQTLAFMLDKGV